MLNATQSPQQNAAPPDQLKTVLGDTPPTPSIPPTPPSTPPPLENSSVPTPPASTPPISTPSITAPPTPNTPFPTPPTANDTSFDNLGDNAADNTVVAEKIPEQMPEEFKQEDKDKDKSDANHDVVDVVKPPFRPSSSTGSAHPPTPLSDVKHDISDTTERDSSYATALATKVGGSAPAIALTKASTLSDAAGTDQKTTVISTTPVINVNKSISGSISSSSSTPPTPPKKKGGKFNAKIVGSIMAVLVLLGGLGAGYYLQTQKQDLEQKAYTDAEADRRTETGATRTRNFCDTFSITSGDSVGESIACKPLVSFADQIGTTPDRSGSKSCTEIRDVVIPSITSKNSIGEFKSSISIENLRDYPISVTYETYNNWCKDAYGTLVPQGDNACWIECVESGVSAVDKTVEIAAKQSVIDTISRRSGGTNTCGSYQFDWRIKKVVNKNSNEVLFDVNDIALLAEGADSSSLSSTRLNCAKSYSDNNYGTKSPSWITAWSICQTGEVCQEGTKISGTVECVDPTGKAQSISSINEGTVTVGDKDYPIVDGRYTADGVTAGQMIAARLNLPATFTVNIDGKPVVVKKESITTQADNGCDTSFMNNNCSGINAERAVQCSAHNNVAGSYEWCTLPSNSTSQTGFDFTVTGCTAAPTEELACSSTTLTPATIVVGGANQMTLTCLPVAGAKSYKLIVPSNTAVQVPVTQIKPAPASGNVTYPFSLNAVPAGTYNASCVPCTGTDGTGCIAPTAASCKDSVTATRAIVGKANCQSKTAYTLNASNAKVTIASGTTTTAGGVITPGQEFMYDVTVTATEQTTGEITVVDTLPSKLTFVSAALNNGTPVTAPSSTGFFRAMSGGRLTFVHPVFGQNATVAAPAKFVITLKVKVATAATPGDVTNAVTITTANATNSTSTCSHKAVIPPDGVASCVSKEMFAVSGTTVGAKIADDSDVAAGTTLQYSINLKATSQTAGSVTITDKLSTDLELVDKKDFDYNTSTRTLSRTLPAFVGEKVLTAQVKVKSDTTATEIGNIASVKTVNASNTTINTNTCAATMKIPSYACNSDCSTTEQCQTANADYICSADNNNRCRLNDNVSSETCQPKTFACNSSCGTDADCRSVNTNYSCVATTDGDRCRLSTNQTATNCLPATSTPTPTPTVGCNQSCTNNADCTNPDHICYNTGSANVCRLAADVNSTTCTTTSTTIASTAVPTAAPAELPQSGPESWATWLKTGLVVIGIGAMLLLLI